ncbi:MAG: branched-chain amino acid ABC transporter permease, partial [Pseudomonadota bacterium]
GTMLGFLASTRLADPKALGIEFILPVYFAAMLAPLWTGRHQILPWGVAAAVGTVLWALTGGPWHIVAGAIAGALMAAIMPPAKPGTTT